MEVITYCLNGYTLEGSGESSVINVEGSLVILGDGEGQEGVITGGNGSMGGGISVAEKASLSMSGGKISGNRAKNGGGIGCEGSLTLERVSIENNHATETDGGGICFSGTKDCARECIVKDCTFSENTAAINGGGMIYLEKGPEERMLKMQNCVFRNNRASEAGAEGGGGGLLVMGKAEVSDCEFSGNYAEGGGGLAVRQGTAGDSTKSIIFRNCNIHENTAKEGGGVYAAHQNLTVSGGKIEANRADSGGGAAVYASEMHLEDSGIIMGNTAQIQADDIYFCAKVGPVSAVLTLPDPTTFGVPGLTHWFSDPSGARYRDGNFSIFENGIHEAAENLYLTVGAGTKFHTVTFDAQGGTPIDQIRVMDGKKVLKPADPEKVGYIFTGWMKEGVPYDFNSPVTKDVTLTAGWEKDPNVTVCVLTYESNGGTAYAAEVYKQGTVAALDKEPERAGYLFNGWYADEQLNNRITEIQMDSDKKVYAGWDRAYLVTFDTQGGSPVESQNVRSGKTVLEPEYPERQGYFFAGWYADKNYSVRYDFTAPVNSDLTIYAKWTADTSGPIKKEIVFLDPLKLDNRYGYIGTKYYTINTTAENMDAITPMYTFRYMHEAVYEFAGWYDNPECEGEKITSLFIDSNKNLYAKWKKKDPTGIDVFGRVLTSDNNEGFIWETWRYNEIKYAHPVYAYEDAFIRDGVLSKQDEFDEFCARNKKIENSYFTSRYIKEFLYCEIDSLELMRATENPAWIEKADTLEQAQQTKIDELKKELAEAEPEKKEALQKELEKQEYILYSYSHTILYDNGDKNCNGRTTAEEKEEIWKQYGITEQDGALAFEYSRGLLEFLKGLCYKNPDGTEAVKRSALHGIVLNGCYDVEETCKLTYVTNGADTELASREYPKGEEVQLEIPKKQGFLFAGWYLDEEFKNWVGDEQNREYKIKEDCTLYAKWKPVAENGFFTIHFECYGGTPEAQDITIPRSVAYINSGSDTMKEWLQASTPVPQPSLEGYTFVGWTYDKRDIPEGIFNEMQENTYKTAIKEYEEKIASGNLTEQELKETKKKLLKTQWSYWSFGNRFLFDTDEVYVGTSYEKTKKDLWSVYADDFESAGLGIDDLYLEVHDLNEFAMLVANYSHLVEMPEFIKIAYPDGNVPVFNECTLHACYIKNQQIAERALLSYVPNYPDGTEGVPMTLKRMAGSKERVAGADLFAFEGARQTGWNTAADGTGDTYAFGSEYILQEGSQTLYAQWAKDSEVHFQPGAHGKLEGDQKYKIPVGSTLQEQGYSAPGIIVEEGWRFTGWLGSDGKTYTSEDLLKTPILQNMTFTAQYEQELTPPDVKKTGDLRVSVKVSGKKGDTGHGFEFKVILGDSRAEGRYGDMTFRNGTAVFTLKHGESMEARGLPAGTSYVIEENNNKGYKVTSQGEKGVIKAGELADALFVNNRNHGGSSSHSDPDDHQLPGGQDSNGSSGVSPNTPGQVPKTGDETNLLLWLLLLGISGIGAGAISLYLVRKNKGNSRNDKKS